MMNMYARQVNDGSTASAEKKVASSFVAIGHQLVYVALSNHNARQVNIVESVGGSMKRCWKDGIAIGTQA